MASKQSGQGCVCGHPFDRHVVMVWPLHDPCAGGTPGFCGCTGYRPTEPSEPPAETQPFPESRPLGFTPVSASGAHRCPFGQECPPIPAEAQQDDVRYRRARDQGIRQQIERQRSLLTREDRDQLTTWEVLEIAAEQLAARPSADTETLLPVRAEIIRQVREAAWHDGYEACRRGDQPHNPYRAALDAR